MEHFIKKCSFPFLIVKNIRAEKVKLKTVAGLNGDGRDSKTQFVRRCALSPYEGDSSCGSNAGVGRLFFGGYTAVSLSLSKKWRCYVWKTICQFTMDVSYFFKKTWDGTVKTVPYIVVCGF